MKTSHKILACLASGLIAYAVACTATQQAVVLTAEQDVCTVDALIGAEIPPGTPVATVFADVAAACPGVVQATGYVEQVIAAWVAAHPSSAAAYKPSPFVLARRGVVVVERKQ